MLRVIIACIRFVMTLMSIFMLAHAQQKLACQFTLDLIRVYHDRIVDFRILYSPVRGANASRGTKIREKI